MNTRLDLSNRRYVELLPEEVTAYLRGKLAASFHELVTLPRSIESAPDSIAVALSFSDDTAYVLVGWGAPLSEVTPDMDYTVEHYLFYLFP